MDLTHRLRGRRVAACFTNGHVLSIRLEDGSEVNVAWLDDNGVPLKGKPALQSSGGRLRAEGIRELQSLQTLLRSN